MVWPPCLWKCPALLLLFQGVVVRCTIIYFIPSSTVLLAGACHTYTHSQWKLYWIPDCPPQQSGKAGTQQGSLLFKLSPFTRYFCSAPKHSISGTIVISSCGDLIVKGCKTGCWQPAIITTHSLNQLQPFPVGEQKAKVVLVIESITMKANSTAERRLNGVWMCKNHYFRFFKKIGKHHQTLCLRNLQDK